MEQIVRTLADGGMDQVVRVEIKSQFGNERIFPVNGTAKTFAAIANTKTLTREVLVLVRNLGFDIDVVQQKVNL